MTNNMRVSWGSSEYYVAPNGDLWHDPKRAKIQQAIWSWKDKDVTSLTDLRDLLITTLEAQL